MRRTVSRKLLAPLVALCMAVAALVIPVAAHLPRWVEVEIVLGAWWLLWVIALSVLLYRGEAVDDDTSPPEWAKGTTKSVKEWAGDAGLGCVDPGCGCGGGVGSEGCLTAILVVAGIVLLTFAILLFVEFVIPAIAILLFASIGGMLARAVNDRHECEGSLALSVLWGVLWSTLYTGPIIALIAWLSAFLSHRR